MGQISNPCHSAANPMSSANSANFPSPCPSSFTIDMDITKALPTRPQAETPVVFKQDCLSVPSEVVATSKEFSELQLSPWSVCAALKGHSSPRQEELLHITQGLAGVAQKNEEVGRNHQKQLEVLHQQGEALAKHKVNMAHLEETYEYWKTDNDKRLADWDQEEWGPEGYEENEGYVSDFFLPVTDGDHTIHVLTPFIKLDGLYCLGTAGIGEPIYRHELFPLQHIMVDKEGEYPYWFFKSLANDSMYMAMYNYSRTQKDWGITAEFQWYHETHTKIATLVTEQRSVATAIEAAQLQLDQSQQCLLRSHVYKQYQLFCTLHKGPYIDSKSRRKFASIPNSSHHGAAQF